MTTDTPRLSAGQIEQIRRAVCHERTDGRVTAGDGLDVSELHMLCDMALASLAEREQEHAEDQVHDSPLLAALKLGPDWFDAVAHACGLSDVEVRAYHAAILAVAQAKE